MNITEQELIKRAQSLARKNKLSEECVSAEVGCALVSDKGNVYEGVSISCACGIGTCAEHGAIQSMLTHDESRINVIVAVTQDGKILPPCGRCRELIYQINKRNYDARIVIRKNKTMKLKYLLPIHGRKIFK